MCTHYGEFSKSLAIQYASGFEALGLMNIYTSNVVQELHDAVACVCVCSKIQRSFVTVVLFIAERKHLGCQLAVCKI